MAKRRNRFLGIDIGHHTIKAVEIEGTDRNNWRIVGVGVAPTPTDAVADGVVALPHLLSDTLRNLMRHNNLTAKSAISSVSGPAISFRPIRLPKMNENQLRKAVLFKARESPTATPIDEMIIEYDVQDNDPAGTDVDVLMVAAPRAVVDSRADVITEAGLAIEAIDMDGFALMRALVEFGSDSADQFKTIAIVCLGHTFTEFNIVTHGAFSFPRSIPIGGSHFNHTLRNSLGLDPASVEEMKHLIDLGSLLSIDPFGGQAAPEQMLRPGLEELIRELTRSINYYQSQFAEGTPEGAVDQVILCGGGARMKGIQDYMSARLRLDVRVADPLGDFFNRNPSPEFGMVRDYSPAMTGALGLALYGLS